MNLDFLNKEQKEAVLNTEAGSKGGKAMLFNRRVWNKSIYYFFEKFKNIPSVMIN